MNNKVLINKLFFLAVLSIFFGIADFAHADTDIIDPNADGVLLQGTQTTCGGAGNFDCVNDAVRSPTAPSTSGDFITLTNNKEDLYAMTTVGNIATVTGVQVFLYHSQSASNMQVNITLWKADEVATYASSQYITNRSTAQWDSVTFSGLTLAQADLNDLKIGARCEKTGSGAPGTCGVYAMYAVITHTANSLFTQNDFRFYINQDDLLTPINDPWPIGSTDLHENKAMTPGQSVGQYSAFRIRMNVTVSNAALASGAQDFKLQYAGLSAPTCVEQGSGWRDVGARFSTTEDFRLYSNAFADTAVIATVLLSTSEVGGSYSELNPTPLNPNSAVVGNDIEYDWPVQFVASVSEKNYCFRMIKSNNSALDVYLSDSFPKVRTKSLGSGTEQGGNSPPGQDTGGGDASGGTAIDDDGSIVGFSSASATGEDFFAWLNPLSGFISDDSNASALVGGLQQDYYNFGLGVPDGNVITGIEFKIEASTSGSGEIQVDISHDGGATYTTVFPSTGALSGSDTIYTVGGGGDLWGRPLWTGDEISNTNFRMRVTSVGVVGAVRIDHIQAKVHHITGGGGSGGGGEVRAPFLKLFAQAWQTIVSLFTVAWGDL